MAEKKNDQQMNRLTVWLKRGLIHRLKITAVKEGRHVKDIIEEAVEDWYKTHKGGRGKED
jgi:hypothetical protein